MIIFHKVGLKHPSGKVGSFVANLLQYLYTKNYQNLVRFDKLLPKQEGHSFFLFHSVEYFGLCLK